MSTADLLSSIERISALADHLETQEGSCPYSRLLLTSWLINQLGNMSALEQSEQEGAPPELYSAYRTLIGKANEG